MVAITKLSKENFADPFAEPEATLCRRAFELGELRLSHLGAAVRMRKLWDPFFFEKVSSSAITSSFQHLHLRLSEAPSELQVIHSERVALERLGTLCSTLEGVECQNSSGAKHRFGSTNKSTVGSRLHRPHRRRGLHRG